jgi:hypothetical protein
LIVAVNIALGSASLEQCPYIDSGRDGRVTVDELISAVASALFGCPFTGQYSAQLELGGGVVANIDLQVGMGGSATGTLSTVTPAQIQTAVQLNIPFVPLTGTVDLDSGAYHLTGTFDRVDGAVPIDVAGALPDRIGLSGTLDLHIGSDTFAGTIAAGSGMPAATPTSAASSPTPTATVTPGTGPTPGDTCADGSISLTFSNADGTNSYRDLAPVTLGKFAPKLASGVWGGTAGPCSVALGDIIAQVRVGTFSAIEAGHSYPLGGGLGTPYFAYLEIQSTNPLGARGWNAHGGTIVIDSLDGDTVRFRVVDAQMVFEPSYSYSSPATGTFTLNASGVGYKIFDL